MPVDASDTLPRSAFKQGQVAVEVASINEVDIPELVIAKSVSPAKLILT